MVDSIREILLQLENGQEAVVTIEYLSMIMRNATLRTTFAYNVVDHVVGIASLGDILFSILVAYTSVLCGSVG
jgi:hypothetical protein